MKIQKEGEVRQENWVTDVHKRGVEERKVTVRSEEQGHEGAMVLGQESQPSNSTNMIKFRQEAVIIPFSSQPLPWHI